MYLFLTAYEQYFYKMQMKHTMLHWFFYLCW